MFITGRAFFLELAGAPLVIWLPHLQTVAAWTALVVAVCLADFLLAANPRVLEISRDLPRAVRLGENVTSQIRLRNRGTRVAAGWVCDAWPPSVTPKPSRHQVRIRPGEGIRLTSTLVAHRRGDRLAQFLPIRLLGPLGFAGRALTHKLPARLRVLPAFLSRKHLPSRLAQLREMDGRTATMLRGAGTEFDSLREYVAGDDVRSIDWRATARRGDVVVRTWRPERDRRVVIVTETARMSAARIGDEPRLDTAIDACLLLATLASHAGDQVEALAIDRVVRSHVSTASGTNTLAVLGDAFAGLTPRLLEADWPLVTATVLATVRQRCLVVIMTTVDLGATSSGLLSALTTLAARHTVVVASVRDREVEHIRTQRSRVEEVFDAAAAERTQLERAALLAQIRALGVEVVDALPEDFAPAVADTYLRLKAAGRL